jgi:peroxiredoxin Q/BCP
MLELGDQAPDFEAPVVGGSFSEGATLRLSDLRGQTVILYFYPKDDTPGCTAQACSLRDHYSYVIERGAAIFGVSVDSVSSHEKFIAKHQLPFPLISDESKEIVQAYGVWVEKSMYGKKYMGVERSTFLIGPNGRIKSIFRKVKPEAHTEILIEDLKHFEP